MEFLSEAKLLQDAQNAKYGLSDEFPNLVEISGEIKGEDTLDKIRMIGRKHGLLTLAAGCYVMFRNPGPSFTIE